ncbi:hypothetical protein [Actinoplanes flavus]|uniref:Secreted protein n=1 Tax=Actinoplanes flavus TaxID=2820290 RepID=A0ABS3UNU9_9ACTN|nr:hypothetical protein [Actinoplanes flavus]MBO3740444.1 hypothetical protein [Actinoplanes flavus]
MTNWMTAAGLAFIAGGLATLISFRTVLFGGEARRANRAGSSARRRRSESTVRSTPGPRSAVDAGPVAGGEPSFGRRRRLAAALSGRPAEPDALSSGLACIGLADEDDEDAHRRIGFADYDPGEDEDHDEPGPLFGDEERLGYEDGYLEDDFWPPRRRRDPEPDGLAWARRDAENPTGYAGRYAEPEAEKPVPDWDWPRWNDVDVDVDDRPPAGDYWTPVPDDLYPSQGFDRLPPVPAYEPATGFDLPVVPAEPEWPPREPVRLPRSWTERDDQRPSPRPRPYVSRHSAGPPA